MPDITGPFIHIMGIGTNTDHARTVARDKLFKPIERIYLIHSPDQTEKRIISKGTKNERILEPIKFKKLAETLKKDLEKTGNKVSLVLLSKDGAYKNTKETINEMTKIIKKEKKKNSFYSSKQFAINVTGGTNMTAVASMLVAGSHQTSAYYVIDERFEENKKLQSNLAIVVEIIYSSSLIAIGIQIRIRIRARHGIFVYQRDPVARIILLHLSHNPISRNI